jgi:phage shock protein PspC (stress-responsive transcriptional regulator)
VQHHKGNVFTRPDTLLGVCQAIGDDFGFNPNWLRITLALPLVWQPTLMFTIYAALGALVLTTRLLIPNRRPAPAAAPAPIRAEPVREPEAEELPLAA